MDIKDILNQNYNVSDATAAEILRVCIPVKVSKGECVVEQDKKCHHLVFVTEGIFRLVFRNGHIEDTLAFGTPGAPFTSICSLFNGEPSRFSFEAVVDSECLMMPYAEVRRLEAENVEFLHWMTNVMEEQLYAFERRYIWFGVYDAYTRYKVFIKQRAEIVNDIPLKYIAQYINVKPETLSRIRARYVKEE